MAEPARFISPKCLREPVPDDTCDSDEYLLSDDYESSSSCSSAVSSEADKQIGVPIAQWICLIQMILLF